MHIEIRCKTVVVADCVDSTLRRCNNNAFMNLMCLDAATIEGMAIDLYRRLDLDPGTPVDTFRLARMLFGRDAIERVSSIVGERGKTYVVRGQRRIAVCRRLPIDVAHHVVGHELGHAMLDEIDYSEEDTERVCDQIGAALMAPLPAVRSMIRTFGPDHELIADEIVATQTWAALRIAEASGMSRAVLTPQRVYVRGPDTFVWCERSLRALARDPRSRPGVAKTRLTDARERCIIDLDSDLDLAVA
jgi:hypothetical protein